MVSPSLTNDILIEPCSTKVYEKTLKTYQAINIKAHLTDRLRVAIRKIEMEHKLVAKPCKHAAAKAATCTFTIDTSADQ